jgi:hypothetical protein
MAIEAPLSRHKRNNFYIYMAVCVAAAAWFAYDGYLNKGFIAEHSDEQGKPNFTLVFNQKAPPVLLGGVLLLSGYLYAIRNRKVVATDDALIIADKQKIPYDAIEKIDKTHFEKKGFFTITYRNEQGRETRRTLDDREYDNLGPILDHLVAQIS